MSFTEKTKERNISHDGKAFSRLKPQHSPDR